MLRESVWKKLCEARGRRYIDSRLSNYVTSCPEQEAAIVSLNEYAADFDERFSRGQNILLLGPVGTGKDHLMFAMARTAVEHFKTALWVNGADLWMAFRQSYNCKRDASDLVSYGTEFHPELFGRETDVTKKLCEVDVLCVSDPLPPSGPLTDSQAEKINQVIDKRYSCLLPTFITVNVADRAEAEQRMGAATVDRLGHDALVVCCDWPSYRQRKGVQ